MVTSAIERSLIMRAVVFPERGGFWRRAAAFWLDLFVVGISLLIITVCTYDLSGGRVQISEVPGPVDSLSHFICLSLPAIPPDIEVPAGFGANYARDCIISIFGYPINHVVKVGRETEHDAVTTDVSVSFMVDKQNTLVGLPPLDLFILPAVIILRWWLDRRKGSLGRRVFGVHVVSAGGAESLPASSSALTRRYAVFALLLAPIWFAQLYEDLNPGFAFLDGMLPVFLGATALIGFLILASVVTIVRRNDSFYDSVGGTRVMQVRPA